MTVERIGKWVGARFVARPGRFIVRAALRDGTEVEAHLADPGRLRELLLPDAILRLAPVAPGNRRRTRYSVKLVRSTGPTRVWVSLDTTAANRLAEGLLADLLLVEGRPDENIKDTRRLHTVWKAGVAHAGPLATD